MRDVWIVTGIPGAGKTSVARLLASRLPRAAHIEGDRLQEWIVSGGVPPGHPPQEEEHRQILSIRNQCLLARSYAESGFVPVVDYVVVLRALLEEYRRQLTGLCIRLVVLAPDPSTALQRDAARAEKTVAEPWLFLDGVLRTELRGLGYWIDSTRLSPEQTAGRAFEHRADAVLPSCSA